jgi:hypothetical protein
MVRAEAGARQWRGHHALGQQDGGEPGARMGAQVVPERTLVAVAPGIPVDPPLAGTNIIRPHPLWSPTNHGWRRPPRPSLWVGLRPIVFCRRRIDVAFGALVAVRTHAPADDPARMDSDDIARIGWVGVGERFGGASYLETADHPRTE